ncbi:hypothetical protein MA16_Dca017802 [Dendrobium catenatum]|uniref:Uncharacterized protein n=1 Tax=Dendrobium catenatum TaxID=906689 RepID=A0A2I0VD79_9ASPA|nr:hypothetical protein MA16_Dca017802 [Dendrobium catenatum]
MNGSLPTLGECERTNDSLPTLGEYKRMTVLFHTGLFLGDLGIPLLAFDFGPPGWNLWAILVCVFISSLVVLHRVLFLSFLSFFLCGKMTTLTSSCPVSLTAEGKTRSFKEVLAGASLSNPKLHIHLFVYIGLALFPTTSYFSGVAGILGVSIFFFMVLGGALLGAAIGFWEKDWPSFRYSDLSFLDAFP